MEHPYGGESYHVIADVDCLFLLSEIFCGEHNTNRHKSMSIPNITRILILFALMVWPLLVYSQIVQIPSDAITAHASSEYYPPLTAASLTIDGSGLTGDLHDNHPQGHTMWLSISGGGGSSINNPAGVPGKAWLLYTLDTRYNLDEMWLWNHNQENLTDRGLRQVSIHYSVDGTIWYLKGQTEFTRAPGTPDYAHTDEIDFGEVPAKYILITAAETDGNYGSAYYGLSEIRLYGEEIPSIPPDYPVQLVSVGIDPVYAEMLTPQSEGWLGSDVAHSIPLTAEKNLWLFADTFIGTVTNNKRDVGAAFINSSIGIQDLSTSPPTHVDFYWGPSNTSFFPHEPGTPGDYYWPTMGAMIGNELFIFCYSVVSGGPLGFSLKNTSLIRIPNPFDPPATWIQNAYDLGIDNSIMGVHSAVIVEEPYLYMMGYNNLGNMILARAATADLLNGGLSEVFEYWVMGEGGARWSDTPSNLIPLFSPSNTETDIHYEPAWDRYFVTTYNAFTPTIYLTTAKELTGPWSEPIGIYEVPEHEAVSFDIISYAVRPHAELSTKPGELIITYATNSLGTVAPLFTEEGLGIYHPRFIRVELSLNEQASVDTSAFLYY